MHSFVRQNSYEDRSDDDMQSLRKINDWFDADATSFS